MIIKVSYYGQSRQVSGVERGECELPENGTIFDLIKLIAKQWGDEMTAILLNEDGKLRQSILLPVNDEVVDCYTAGLLKDGDEISILSALSGG